MSLIFEALQKLDRRRAGLDSHSKLDIAELSQHAERKTMPRWETDPIESDGEVPLSEYEAPARFSDPVFAEPSFAGPAFSEPSHVGPSLVDPAPVNPVLSDRTPADNIAVSPAPTDRPSASPVPASFVPPVPAPAVPSPDAPSPELAVPAPASPVFASPSPAGLTVSEAPSQSPAPPSRAVAPSRPPQPPAPAQAFAPTPTRPKSGVDLTAIMERLVELKTQQRDLRELGIERKASLARLGDHLEDVRLSSDRNTREQSELFKELRGIGKKINFVALAAVVLTAASVVLSFAVYLRFLNILH